MRQILIYIALSLVLLAGCRQTGTDSPRLVELDSLIAVAPDSAAALLLAMPTDSLPTANDRAYHALLLTQAKYKAYIPATDDSLINLAVHHFVTHGNGDYDRRIRSLIYKGCVMTELGQPDSAIYWFSRAETAAHRDDHANLGYIYFRMGDIYMNELQIDSITIQCYETALKHFNQSNSTYRLSATLKLGSILLVHDNQRGRELIRQAKDMAQSLGDTVFIWESLEQMAFRAIQDQNFEQAKNCAMESIKMNDSTIAVNSFASIAYSNLNQSDSALILLHSMPQPQNILDRLHYHRAYAEYARSLNTMDEYVLHNDEAGRITDTIFLESQQKELKEVEEKYQNSILQEQLTSSRFRLWLIVALLALSTAIAYLLGSRLVRLTREHKMSRIRLEDAVRQLADLNSALSHKEDDINKMRASNAEKRSLVEELIESIYATTQHIAIKHKSNNSLRLSESFWLKLYDYVNEVYDTILDNDGLNEKEKNLLCLCCLGVPIEISATALNLSVKSAYNYRNTIARKISNGQISNLDQAIKSYKSINN